MENIAHLKTHPRFRYEIEAITNEPLLAELIDGSDFVVHLAATVGVKRSSRSHTIETNVHGTEVIFKQANKKKKIRGLTGYEPKVHLDQILTRVIDYFQTR